MISLFLDTSSKNLIVELLKDNEVLFSKNKETLNNHSEFLLPFINEGLNENNILPKQIDKIFVVVGPGSFTGTRIGVTVGKTLAYSIKKNIIPVSSLKMKVLGLKDNDYYISIIKDRKNYIYYAIYDKEYNEIVKDCYSSIEKLKKDINKLESNYKIICDDDIDLDLKYEKSIFNIKSIVDYYQEKEINSYLIKPNYLKIIEAESKL
jgi:tRNA threonylcarbamoyladenosine biosynthesis protein TsaB